MNQVKITVLKTFIACCTDGIKPVVFRLEQLES